MRARLCAIVLLLGIVASGCGSQPSGARQISAVFPRASSVFVGSEVRVLGVQVGKITEITPEGDTVRVDMELAADQPLPADVGAALVPTSLLGERVIQLEPPYTDGPEFTDDVIPMERTALPAEVDEVLRSFQSFAAALDEKVLAELIDTAAVTLEGQGPGLNRLIDQGAETVQVLDSASGDLNGLVAELGQLNETLATRDQKIGRTLERLSDVMRLFAEEKGNIIGSIDELRRFTAELRPLVDEHTDPLVRDLEVLATTLSTVDRNLGRVAETITSSERLLKRFAPLVGDYENGRTDLYNLTDQLFNVLALRLADRLEGVCLRLGLKECASSEFWQGHIPAITCVGDEDACSRQQTTMGDALAAALGQLPEESRRKIARDVRRRANESEREQAEQEQPKRKRKKTSAPEPLPKPTPKPAPSMPPLPLPDPRLDTLDNEPVLGGGG
jgi:virulence factor Mce-like protein